MAMARSATVSCGSLFSQTGDAFIGGGVPERNRGGGCENNCGRCELVARALLFYSGAHPVPIEISPSFQALR